MLGFRNIEKYCISLRRSKERRESVKDTMYFHELAFDFFDAVDKQKLVIPELSIKLESADSPVKKSNALGAYACMLSHVECLKKFLSTNDKMAFIFEDDIKLCDDFEERMAYIDRLREHDEFDFDILALGGHFPCEKPGDIGHHAESTRWRRIYRVNNMSGSYGYVVTRPVAEFIVRNATYNYGVDEFLSTFVYKRFRAFAFLPFPVGHKEGFSEITEVNWHYDNADWFYEQGAVDLSAEYLNHIVGVEVIRKQQHDAQREAWLKGNG